jgi:hypothetical protein
MYRLRTAQALALQNAMLEARRTLDEATKKYNNAFAIAMDTGVGADGMFALRREGAAHAQAVNWYLEASMAWLAYVDTQLRPPFKTKGAGS